ncbi:MAG: hypothetical protein LBB77_02105 [Treponema sp.]|nr:hypothetical protein [Treponema sp.]
MKNSGLCTALLLVCAVPLAAQVETAFHGSVETIQAVPVSSRRSLTDSRTAFTGELLVFAGQASAFVSLSAEYNGVSPERTDFSLGEAWLDWGRGDFSVRLGRQFLSWGAAAGLILTDVVCPQNLSAYAGLDFTGSRLAVDGLKLRYSFPVLAVEAVWLPLFTPARLPGSQNPLYDLFYPSSINTNPPMILNYSPDSPPRTIADGEYGLRVSCYTGALDFSFMGFYGWNDIPYLDKELFFVSGLPGLQITPAYGRTVTAGADARIPLGEFLLKLEAAWTGGGRYERPAGDTVRVLMAGQRESPLERHNLKLLAGLDWNPSGWTVSAQYYGDLLPGGSGVERSWWKNALTLRLARGLFRETLTLSFWCFLDLKDFDSAGSVSAAYALTDSLSFSLGSDFFTGGIDGRGNYAAYKDLSCIWFRGILRF